MKKQEDLITLLKRQDVCHGSSECHLALIKNAPFISAPPLEKQNFNEKKDLAFIKGYIYTKRISAKYALKWQWSAANCREHSNFQAMQLV